MNSKLWDEGVAYFTEINVTEMFGNSASAAEGAKNGAGFTRADAEKFYSLGVPATRFAQNPRLSTL